MNILHMYDVRTRCVEKIRRAKTEASSRFEKSFFWRLNFEFFKQFFQTLTRPLFWLVESFLRILHARHTYVKCPLESKLTFYTTWSITRHVEMDTRQEKAIFVGFEKIMSWHSHKPISRVKKSFFQTLTRLLFWLAEFFLRIFHAYYTYWFRRQKL